MTPASTRQCVQCKKPFEKRTKESHQKFNIRLYCSQDCSRAFSKEVAEKNKARRADGLKPLTVTQAREIAVPGLHSLLRDPSMEMENASGDEGTLDLDRRIERAVADTLSRGQTYEARA